PPARSHGKHAGHQRQHGGIGKMKQKNTAGEDEQRPVLHQRARPYRRFWGGAAAGARGGGRAGASRWAPPGSPPPADIMRSASKAGTRRSTVTIKTARADKREPHAPIAPAASALPAEAKRALRPSRSLMAPCPTRPRLIAAIAGPSTQLAAACPTAAESTTGKIG